VWRAWLLLCRYESQLSSSRVRVSDLEAQLAAALNLAHEHTAKIKDLEGEAGQGRAVRARIATDGLTLWISLCVFLGGCRPAGGITRGGERAGC
jgi:hypothetical protein